MSEEKSGYDLIQDALNERLDTESDNDANDIEAEVQLDAQELDTPEVKEQPVDANVSFTESEQEAYSKGWRPKEQFAGNPDDWVPADQFIARGPFMGQIVGLKKEIDILKENMRKTEQAGYERALAELNERKEQARLNQDFNEYENVNKELDELNNKVEETPELPEATKQFVENNKWFTEPTSGEDLLMKQDALALSDLYQAQQPDASEATNIKMVVEALSVKYPHRFGNKQQSAPSVVGVNDRGSKVVDNSDAQFSKLPRGLKSLGNEYIKLNVYKDKKEFIEYLKSNGRI